MAKREGARGVPGAETALGRYAAFLTRHAWLVLLVVGAATVAIGLGMGRLRSNFDVESSMPADHPYVQVDREIRREFGGRNTVIVAIEPREGTVWRPEVLEVVRQVTLDALQLPDVIAQNVVSLAAPSVRHIEESGGALSAEYLMRDVPRSDEEIAALRARVDDDPQLRGMLVTPDDRMALVLVDYYEGVEAQELGKRTLALVEPYRDKPVDFYLAGEPIFSLSDVEQSNQIGRRIPIIFGVIAVMLLISFRNLQGMLIPMLTAGLTTVWGLGLMGWTGIAIDAWNVAVPIFLIAVAAAHSAQMLKRYVEEVERLHDNRAAVVASTAAVGPVMIAAGSVAALGFLSLIASGIESISHFGIACAYGIGSAVLLEMTFIPALRSILPAPRGRVAHGGPSDRILAALQRAISRNGGRSVLIGTAVAVALGVVGMLQIRTYGSTREYLPKKGMQRLHLEEIERHFAGTVTMTILYRGEPGSMKGVATLKHMTALQAELEKDPLVWRTQSLADLVKILHKTFNREDADPYRVPDDQELVSQLVFLGDSPAFERFWDRAQSEGLVTAWLRDDDSARVAPLMDKLRAWLEAHPAPPGVTVLVAGGVAPTVLAVNQHTTRGKLLNMGLVIATIYVVSSLMMRSPLGGLYVITPIALSVLLLFGLLGWTGTRLDMGTASVISLAAGVGADYAIYFLYRLREERAHASSDAEAVGNALQTSGRAVIFVASSIGAGFAVIGYSEFYGMQIFGVLMPAAMVLSCLAAISIMPVLVLRTRPRFIFGAAAEPRGLAEAAAPADGGAAAGATRSLAVVLGVAAALAAALAPVASRGADAPAALAPGTVLEQSNAAAAKDLLPAETHAHYAAGEYRSSIAAWPAAPAFDAEFLAASQKVQGRVDVDENGTIVDRGTKTPAHGIYGLPFHIEPSDAAAGVKAVWNAYYALWRTGSSHDVMAMDWIGRKGLERQAVLESDTLYYEGAPPDVAPKENPLDLAAQQLAVVTQPADLSGTASLEWRYRDPSKHDSSWTYVPALRRVRQISPTNRSDGFLGSDLSQDDGTFFNGKPEDFTWKLVGEREALVLADPASLAGKVQQTALAGGGYADAWPEGQTVVGYQSPEWKGLPWAPVAPVLVKRKLWVIEAAPRDPYYLFPRIELTLDQETFQGATTRKFDAHGGLLRSIAFLLYGSQKVTGKAGASIEPASSMGYIVAENLKANRATVVGTIPPGQSRHDRRVPMDPQIFALERLGAGK